MKNEIQTAIDQIRILFVLIETGELEEYEIQLRAGFICETLEGIAERLPEVDA